MADTLEYLAPRLVLLLAASPWIGVATVLAAARGGQASTQRAAISNVVFTALIASCLWLTLQAGERGPDSQAEGWGFRAVRAVWIPERPGATSPPWSVEFGFSIGFDAVNAGILFGIPWLTLASVLSFSGRGRVRTGLTVGVLALEGSLLLSLAAQDALTFCLGTQGVIVSVWLLTGWYGSTERRSASEKYFRWQQFGQVLWTIGLLALAIAAIWVQQEIRNDARVIRCDWEDLSRTLPKFVSRYIVSFEYWAASETLIVMTLMAGTVIWCGLIPGHSWLPTVIQEMPGSAALLQIGAASLVGGYLFLRCVAPGISAETGGAGWMSMLGAWSSLIGGLLALAQTDLRKFVAYWWISMQGNAWVVLASASPIGQSAGWLVLQSSAATAAGLMLIVHLLEVRYDTRELDAYGGLANKYPRFAAAACLVLLPAIGLPAARGLAQYWWHLIAFSSMSGLWWLATGGWLCTAWASIWMLQRVLFGRLREPLIEPRYSHEPFDAGVGRETTSAQGGSFAPQWHSQATSPVLVQDLSLRELAAVGLTLVVPAIVEYSALWRSAP